MPEEKPEHFVVVISGTSGAGKTSLVRKTAELLGDAVCFYFDDYESVSQYPSDMKAWLREGADPSEWKTPQMAVDLRALRQGSPIPRLDGQGELVPKLYIVVEDPFGRARTEMQPSIDLAVFIDTPMEVALARKILRETQSESFRTEPGKLYDYLRNFLPSYLEFIRALYLCANDSARSTADLVLDGLKPIEDLAQEIVERIRLQQNKF